MIKNISFSEAHKLVELVDYSEGKVVSRTLAQTESMNLTLFAFDKDEGLSTHSASGDAFVQVLDGEVLLNIGGKDVVAENRGSSGYADQCPALGTCDYTI